jgi:hypothetical protein
MFGGVVEFGQAQSESFFFFFFLVNCSSIVGHKSFILYRIFYQSRAIIGGESK